MSDLHEVVKAEIEALHGFFVGWFGGSLPSDAGTFDANFAARFDEEFILIPPAGITQRCEDFFPQVRSAHASNPSFRIAIRNVQVRREERGLVLATYEEWQRNALASTPPDNGRVASVLFRRAEGLRWLHVHETWLPEEVMRAGPYDF